MKFYLRWDDIRSLGLITNNWATETVYKRARLSGFYEGTLEICGFIVLKSEWAREGINWRASEFDPNRDGNQQFSEKSKSVQHSETLVDSRVRFLIAIYPYGSCQISPSGHCKFRSSSPLVFVFVLTRLYWTVSIIQDAETRQKKQDCYADIERWVFLSSYF